MTANELADKLDMVRIGLTLEAATMLRRQAEEITELRKIVESTIGQAFYEDDYHKAKAEIEELKKIIKRLTVDWTDDFKNYKYNSDVPEQNKMRDDVFAILNKASEK